MTKNLKNFSGSFRLRISYSKRGRLVYLSHKETVLALERCIRRAQLPFDISKGFSPHMKISFGPALPTGVGGLHEFVDLSLINYVEPELALQSLQKTCAKDLFINDCFYVELNEDALDAKFTISNWQVTLQDCVIDAFKEAESSLFSSGVLEIQRKNKNPKVININKFIINRFHQIEKNVFEFSTKSYNDGALRPDIYIKEIFNQMGQGDAYFAQVKSIYRISLGADDKN